MLYVYIHIYIYIYINGWRYDPLACSALLFLSTAFSLFFTPSTHCTPFSFYSFLFFFFIIFPICNVPFRGYTLTREIFGRDWGGRRLSRSFEQLVRSNYISDAHSKPSTSVGIKGNLYAPFGLRLSVWQPSCAQHDCRTML